jgi:ubiquinone biosynthesis monooxygenase Coq7
MIANPNRGLFDRLIAEIDHALRVVAAPAHGHRPNPADAADCGEGSTNARLSGGLMRVNHTGEIAAQALYRGQALVAQDQALRDQLLQAAEEENDHLAWCEQRLDELQDRPSHLAPAWYAGSFAIGAVAGIAGDSFSLGFLAETEKQVEAHLDSHLDRLPSDDHRSRAIVAQMRDEEADHRLWAEQRGGEPLPLAVKDAMKTASRVMTALARYL